MTISQYNSNKIKALSFLSIIFVIYIHAPYIEASAFPMAKMVQAFVSDFGLAIFAIPMFYAISGMLFFNGMQKVNNCFLKMKKRVQSLLIPYVIWNLIFVGWYVVMAYAPGISAFVNSDMLSKFQISDPTGTLRFLFIEPAGFHLWFLRDLMFFVLISPLLYHGLKRAPWLTVLLVFFATAWYPRFGLCYFVAGGALSMHSSLEKLRVLLTKPVIAILGIIYLGNAIITITCGTCIDSIWWQYYEKLIAVAAILFVWGIYDLLFKEYSHLSPLTSQLIAYTFFIYLFHEPSFNIIKKLTLKVLGVHDWSLILLFLVNPWIMVVIAICVGMIFRKLLPKTYTVCVGGR